MLFDRDGINMLTNRQQKIIQLLQSKNNFQQVDMIAKQLGVSKRTVYADLLEIEKNSQNITLIKKRGVGVLIKKEDVQPYTLTQNTVNMYDVDARRLKIMELLLFEQKPISFNQLSQLFLVSKSSLINDFHFVVQQLGIHRKVELVSNHTGSYLDVSELRLQQLCLRFNELYLQESEIVMEDIRHKVVQLIPYYGEDTVIGCSNLLYRYVKQHLSKVSDVYIQRVLNIFVILVCRLKKGYHVQLPNTNRIDARSYRDSAEYLLRHAAVMMQFSYTEEDSLYFAEQLASNRFDNGNLHDIRNDIAIEIIQAVSEALMIDFANDTDLKKQLMEHLASMIVRLKQKQVIENPFTAQIKLEYAVTFSVIWGVLCQYEQELHIQLTEDEIAFLTIYFQSAIERAKANKKILIVCQMGLATSELLLIRIKHILPSIDRIETASFVELESYHHLSEYDLIISTIRLHIEHSNVLYVSPILTTSDIENIKKQAYTPVESTYGNHQSVFLFHKLTPYICHETVYMNTNYQSKEELLMDISLQLEEKQIVDKQFKIQLLEREAQSDTDLPTGIAIPHGNPMSVHRTRIVVVKNKRKLKWNQYFVDIVFMICIAKEDLSKTREIMTYLYELLENQHYLQQIRTSPSAIDWFNQLKGGI